MTTTNNIRTFYFNTGVNPANVHNPEFPYEYHKRVGNVIRNGVLQIPFDCENVPENATFKFLTSNPELDEAKNPEIIVRKVLNSSMASEYAYFIVPSL